MSIIIKHQQQRLAELESQLAHVTNTIDQHGNEMEGWELKEYKAVQADYQKDLTELREALERVMQDYPETEVATPSDTIRRVILNS